jgi:hypothetical protein
MLIDRIVTEMGGNPEVAQSFEIIGAPEPSKMILICIEAKT